MSRAAAPVKRSIFSSRSFRLFFIGQTLSLLGDGFRLLAIPLLVYKLTHSALSTGLSYFFELAPFALFGLVAGSLADRLNRRSLMLISNAVRFSVMIAFAVLYALRVLSVQEIYGGLVKRRAFHFCSERNAAPRPSQL
jgi:MFS family permease